MTKLLKIRFVKFEHALVGQQIGVSGIEFFEKTEHIGFLGYGIDFAGDAAVGISLSPASITKRISTKYFDSNEARDEYLNNVVKWITDEQFTSYAGAPQEVGELCTVSDDGKHWRTARVIAILPNKYKGRYIYEDEGVHEGWACATHAHSFLERVEPKTEGDVYMWEMEVSDER